MWVWISREAREGRARRRVMTLADLADAAPPHHPEARRSSCRERQRLARALFSGEASCARALRSPFCPWLGRIESIESTRASHTEPSSPRAPTQQTDKRVTSESLERRRAAAAGSIL